MIDCESDCLNYGTSLCAYPKFKHHTSCIRFKPRFMDNERELDLEFTDQMKEYIGDLVKKSLNIMESSKLGSNVGITMYGATIPVRVDDYKLMYIGAYLLPNILNYLVNIIPQFLYPYIVAYLQDLSTMRDDPITINELFDYLINYNHGNIHECTETEG